MSKKYSFEFLGTKEMFLNQLKKFSDTSQRFFYFDNYIVELSNDEIRFGIARGGHSGGYWFIPEITEYDNKISFCGTIKYIDVYSEEKGIKKVVNSIEEILWWILLFPIILLLKLYVFFWRIAQKIKKRPITKGESVEDKLYNLMENYLNCTRQ